MFHPFKPPRAVLATAVAILFTLHSQNLEADILIDFEDVNLGSNSFNNGENGLPTSGGATFENNYSSASNSWSGWSFSSVQNGNVGGFSNQYASRPNGAASGSRYAVAYTNTQMFDNGTRTIPSASIRFNQAVFANSMQVTNTAWAYFAMLVGDGPSRRFGADDTLPQGVLNDTQDLFELRVLGVLQGQQTGTFVDFVLADYRFADRTRDFIVDDWRLLDLTALGQVDELQFQLFSTDFSGFQRPNAPLGVLDYYVNTPGYFAIDNLSVTAVPEPTSLALLVAVGCGSAYRYCKRNRKAIPA